MNDRHVIREGHSSSKKASSELSNSGAKVRHRQTEKRRREAIRQLQDQISIFFLVPGQKKVTIGDVLLFGKLTDSRSESAGYSPNCFSYHLSKDR